MVDLLKKVSDLRSELTLLQMLDRVDRAIRSSNDLNLVLEQVLDRILEIFSCDRAWLLFPCDPETDTFRVPMERTRDGWPGALETGVEVPTNPLISDIFMAALATNQPVPFDDQSELAVPPEIAAAFNVRSQLIVAVRPKRGLAWLLGIHHCRENHIWNEAELNYFHQIGRRVGDALASLLLLQELRASEHKFRLLIEQSPEAIMVIEPTTSQILMGNPAAVSMFAQTEEELGELFFFDLCRGDREAGEQEVHEVRKGVRAVLEGHCPVLLADFKGAAGKVLNCEVRLALIDHESELAIRVMLTNVTEKVELDRALQRKRKLESLGRMSGGVAHDFNNLLVAILGYTELLLTGGSLSAKQIHRVKQVQNAGERAAELTNRLLAFGRGQPRHPDATDLNQVVNEVRPILEVLLREDVRLELDLDPEAVVAWVDGSQVHQVLINLVANAQDAIREDGRICLRTRRKSPKGEDGGTEVVMVEVEDNGVGIQRSELERIFEPFYTTKDVGHGAGLGLATVYGIVGQSDGTICVDSIVGSGSSFKVFLPAGQSQEPDAIPASPEPVVDLLGRTVLVAEDDPEVARLIREILIEEGCQVLLAESAEAALATLEGFGADAIDILLTDMVMTGMSGLELLYAYKRIAPAGHVVLMSGYSEHLLEDEIAAHVPFLPKPFTPEQLVKCLSS